MHAAEQRFETGRMYWFELGKIFAVADDGWWGVFDDDWDQVSRPFVAPAPEGLFLPERGFLWAWYHKRDENDERLRGRMGYATEAGEEAYSGDCQEVAGGWRFTNRDLVEVELAEMTVPPEEPSPLPPPPAPPSEPPADDRWKFFTCPISGWMVNLDWVIHAEPDGVGLLVTVAEPGRMDVEAEHGGNVRVWGRTTKWLGAVDAVVFRRRWEGRK